MTRVQRSVAGLSLSLALVGAVTFAITQKRGDSIVLAFRISSGLIFFAEDSNHSLLKQLKRRERLEDVVKRIKSQSEIDRLVGLAVWTKQLFPSTSPFPNYPPWNANAILEMIRSGETGGFCAQYAIVFGQACQSLGYLVRYHDLGKKNGDGGHFIPEVYVPSLRKWIAVEPEFGHIYQDGKKSFLGVLELHEYASGQRKGTVLKYPQNEKVSKDRLELFAKFRYYLRNNFLSLPVFIAKVHHPNGTRIIFEPYRLSYGSSKSALPRGSEAIVSSRKEDFMFELNLETPTTITCRSFDDLVVTLQQLESQRLYRFRIERDFYGQWEERIFGPRHPYNRLTRQN